MKRLVIITLASLPLLAACTATSGADYRKQVAWNRCANSPGPDARESCITTQIALMEAADRAEAESLQARRQEAEDRQAQAEAHGVPPEAARQTTDSGLTWPK
ncbi:MAG: hypothetical protein VR74_02950 [Hyphomonas sp. BRH_c22]|uniref:hypothetical protein n=1 Tax=Hyphomonas sp. BRH_c22 TaxID=1629710 RepID=UPI0005F1B1E7|nr:hypothetical protein [Hyphomonas sp. BRH_c22]KJS35604.1 MAG: hypothetical protein VR74_15710 [Hyphomonas sp. BRH_c22]KJS39206.1 MAG: hypothetical protein VR74_02950 [Hyphomonas sp. BRH_c22]